MLLSWEKCTKKHIMFETIRNDFNGFDSTVQRETWLAYEDFMNGREIVSIKSDNTKDSCKGEPREREADSQKVQVFKSRKGLGKVDTSSSEAK